MVKSVVLVISVAQKRQVFKSSHCLGQVWRFEIPALFEFKTFPKAYFHSGAVTLELLMMLMGLLVDSEH